MEHLCLDVRVKPGHDGTLSAIEKSCHERIDPLRNAGLDQRRADQAARALKFYVFGQGHGGGDNFGLVRGPGDGIVEGIARVEARNRQVEHDFVEMPRTPLAARLTSRYPRTGRLTVKQCYQEEGLLLALHRRPVQTVFDYIRSGWYNARCCICPRSGINHTQPRKRKLRAQFIVGTSKNIPLWCDDRRFEFAAW